MYLALTEMRIRTPDCPNHKVQPGDEVPGFDRWSPWVQKAMLDERRVRWAPEGLAPHELASVRKVEQHIPQVHVLPAPPKPPQPQTFLEEIVPKGADEQQNDLLVAAPSALPDAGVVIDTPDTAAAVGSLSCSVCDKTGFTNKQGLKIHMARAHKQ